jgi:hypothetical protein
VKIADHLGYILPHVNFTRLSLCGMWSRDYARNLTTLGFEFCHWPFVDIFLFFSGLISAKNLETLNLLFRCFDIYDATSPTSQNLATLAESIGIELKRVYRITLFVDTDFHYPISDDEEENPHHGTDSELSGDQALMREGSLWKCCLESMKSVRIVEIQEFSGSRREILEFVDNLEMLELLISEKEQVWIAEKATQMGLEWRLK